MRILTVILMMLMAPPVMGGALGTFGNTYQIQEEDGADYLKRRMLEYKKDGTVDKKIDAYKEKIKNKIYNPEPVSGITKAIENNLFYFDPTIVTDRSITDAKGRILFPAGTKVNPLSYGGLSSRYIFIDARDKAQVEFATKKQRSRKDKIILVGGSWVNLSKSMGFQVYYDQFGYLTKKFNITHVPALLEQDGLKLKIEEFAL